MATATPDAVQKALDRVNAQVAAGNYYEAQQMYKTVYHRYRSRRQAEAAYQVLQEGAVTQLGQGQVNCGMELGSLLVVAYTTDKVEATPAALARLEAILRALPGTPGGAGAGPPSTSAPSTSASGESSALEDAGRFAMAAIKWAHKQGQDEAVRSMHDTFAAHVLAAYGWQQFGRAQAHWARGKDADAFAAALQQCSALGGAGEGELWACRAVLQTLASAHPRTTERQRQHAAKLLAACQARGLAPQGAPLMHFCTMLLQALDRRSKPLAALLEERYGPSLARDPALGALLDKALAVYFPGAAGGAGSGLLGSLLRGMLMEGDEDE